MYNTTYLNKEHKDIYGTNFDYLFSTKKLAVETVQNGIILPIINDEELLSRGGVVSKKGEFQKLSGWYRDDNLTYPMAKGYDFDDVNFINEDVIYCGVYIHQWGHFLLESTTRLWYYLSLIPEYRQKYKLAFLCHYKQKPHGNMLEFFNLLGITEDTIIPIEKPTQFRSVIIPEQSSRLGRVYTKEFLIPFNKIIENIEPAFSQKVYLSRAKFKENANTIGEEKIEKIFSQNNFEIIYPETLTLKEQISIMQGAKQIAMLNGSASHNTLFCKPQTEVIIINRFSISNDAQYVCDFAKKLKTIYIDSYQTFLPALHGRGPFLMSVTKNLQQFIVDRKMKLNQKLGCSTFEIMQYLKRWSEIYNKKENFTLFTPEFFEVMPEAFASFFQTQQEREHSSLKYRLQAIFKRSNNLIDYTGCSDILVLRKSRLFRKMWYWRHYWRDLLKSKLSAEEHYLTIGFKEGKNPSHKFNNNFYLNTYPDIKSCGMNPLIHYERYGRKEHRIIKS